MSDVLPIVDTHHHLWDLDRFHLPWLAGAPKLDRSFVMADYFAATDGLNVVRTVYMEVDVDPSQQDAEAEYVIDLCERSDNPMAGAVISGRPALPGFVEYIGRYAGNPFIKGVRQVLHGGGTPAGYCLQAEFVRGIRLLGELSLSFDLCLRPGELADGARLVDQCPETRFVVDHCGNANVQASDRSQWERDLAVLAARENTVCKISGIVASAKPGGWTPADLAPIIQHCLRAFGPDRVFFGGDWPVCTLAASYRQWVEALMEIVRDLPAEQQRKLFHDNAVRFYALA
jgi:L-fuconolactonase